MSVAKLITRAGLEAVHQRVLVGSRLSPEDGMALYACPDLPAVGYLANLVRQRLHGDTTYYVRNQHLNYTNVCNKLCRFCSFYVTGRDAKGYVLSPEQAAERVRQYAGHRISEIHMVGGVNPKLPYQYYLDLLRAVKAARPEAHLKAFTMIEVAQIQRAARKPLEEVLTELRQAGLESLPGGGAEVFSARVQGDLFWTKADSEEWLRIAGAAHRCGLPSNATMLYGHIENTAEKVQHLCRLREVQDQTQGFRCYVPLSFHPERTELAELPGPTGCADLREVAVGRLLLDNFPHVKTFWIMNTIEVSQTALWYGADDLDGTVMDYEITRRTEGETRQRLTHEELLARIGEAGRIPVERDSLYRPVPDDTAAKAEAAG